MRDAKPLLTIIIPVYNSARSIGVISKSILSERFTDFELILVDDGSTDDTLSKLKAIQEKDNRVRVFTKTNGGPSSARNYGVEKSRGKYIQFYDSDDNVADGALQTTISAISENDSDVLASGWQIDLQAPQKLVKNYEQIRPTPELVTENTTSFVLRSLGDNGTLYNLWNKLFRADIIHQNKLRFREELRFGEDLVFALEYFQHIKSLRIVPDVTYHYLTSSSTGEFSRWSIVPEHRVANDEAIIEFAGNSPSPTERDLLDWVRWRWLMSYWSLVAGSNKSFSEKLSLIDQFKPVNLRLAHIKTIGWPRFLLQLATKIASVATFSSLLLAHVMMLLKQIIIMAKTALK